LGNEIDAGCASYIDDGQLLPIRMHEIIFWDEKHQKTCLGCNSKHEVLVSRNDAGELAKEGDGGLFPPRLPVTTVKYPQEARMCFGVAVLKHLDGSFDGVRAIPYDYTSLTVLGPTKFTQKRTHEQARVKGMK
jgi:hypothetical protein